MLLEREDQLLVDVEITACRDQSCGKAGHPQNGGPVRHTQQWQKPFRKKCGSSLINQDTHKGRRDEPDKIPEDHLIDPVGVTDRMKVRPFIIVFINRFNGNRDHGQLFPAAGNEYIHFILIPFTGGFDHHGQMGSRKYPQTGLCIREPCAIEQLEYGACTAVPEPGLGRDEVQRKVTAAKIQRILSGKRGFTYLKAVSGCMLTVTVGCEYPLNSRCMLHQIPVPGLQCSTLAAVHIMMQDPAGGTFFNGIKDRLTVGVGAVVNDQHMAEPRFFQRVQVLGKLFVRIQCRDQDCHFCNICMHGYPFHGSFVSGSWSSRVRSATVACVIRIRSSRPRIT